MLTILPHKAAGKIQSANTCNVFMTAVELGAQYLLAFRAFYTTGTQCEYVQCHITEGNHCGPKTQGCYSLTYEPAKTMGVFPG